MDHSEFSDTYLKINGTGNSQIWYDKTGEWIYTQYFSRKTGISLEHYYESKVDRPICQAENCDTPTSFYRISTGFNDTCSSSCKVLLEVISCGGLMMELCEIKYPSLGKIQANIT